MRAILATIFVAGSLLLANPGYTQVNAADETILTKAWNAYWIAAKSETGKDYGLYYFRKRIDL